jgi:hypothetical protein
MKVKIPVRWTIHGYFTVEAESFEDGKEKLIDSYKKKIPIIENSDVYYKPDSFYVDDVRVPVEGDTVM